MLPMYQRPLEQVGRTRFDGVPCARSLPAYALPLHPPFSAVYITYFDAIINEYLCRVGGLIPRSTDSPIGLVVSSNFSYAAALEFPAPLLAGLSVTK